MNPSRWFKIAVAEAVDPATKEKDACGRVYALLVDARSRVMRCGTTLLVVTIMFTLACSESTRASTTSTSTATPLTAAATLPPAQARLASDPAQLAGDSVVKL